MSATAEQLRQALIEGRRAEPGTPNPYYGMGALAVAWRRGYTQNLTSLVNNGPGMRAFYAAHAQWN
jgi:hypothetical protein